MDIDFSPQDKMRNLPGTALQQCGTYADVMVAFGCDAVLADMYKSGTLLGRARIYLRRFGPLRMAWLPRGPVWTDAATPVLQRRALAALPRAAPWRAIWAVGSDANTGRRGLPVARGCTMAELDLTPCAADRRAAQHGKWRNRLKRAEEAGLRISARRLNLRRDVTLLACETAQQRARGYAALPPAFTENWTKIAPDHTLILTAEENGISLGFMLMLLHAPIATYHIGWTGPRGRALNVHNLLFWRASQDLATRGYARLDLGHADFKRTPGLARFKMGSGAAAKTLGPTTLCL
ncbi:GNAT family N-acetyltransferase [Roseovarius dicentrarchi]|uniref:GNAT family N-acetyltransferase n=1 Tax=Roseovarius dicentrarchi TaxID=2250573 RepID=UPI000DE84F24|nr:GNAT family N-acetyltransferase [Roseovarius dicentrarchi]